MSYGLVNPVIDLKVLGLCRKPYEGHKKGCPNWGKYPSCPPQAPLLADLLELSRPVYAIWATFDLAAHAARMKEKHPEWTDRQLVNCLYWQGTARKLLRQQAAQFLADYPAEPFIVLFRPEACGVNVGATMAQLGITLEWQPRNTVHLVALAGNGAYGQVQGPVGWEDEA